MKLHRQLGISYNAAWRMRPQASMQVMMERDSASIKNASCGFTYHAVRPKYAYR